MKELAIVLAGVAGFVSVVTIVIMGFALCFALAEFIRPDEFSGFFGWIFGTLAGFGLAILSIPAWITGGILRAFFGGDLPPMSGGEPWALVRLNLPLLWFSLIAWIPPLLLGSAPSFLVPLFATIFPSEEARRNGNATGKFSSLASIFSAFKATRTATEEAERALQTRRPVFSDAMHVAGMVH